MRRRPTLDARLHRAPLPPMDILLITTLFALGYYALKARDQRERIALLGR